MAKNYDTKSNTVGNTSQETIYREPPPPHEYEGGGSSRLYDGGPTEQTPFFQQQPSPQYAPTDDHNYHGGNKMPLEALRDESATTTCPHCNGTVPSRIEYKNGYYTWLCCLALCFDPFYVSFEEISIYLINFASLTNLLSFFIQNNDYKDVDHICPKCSRVMITYSRKCSC